MTAALGDASRDVRASAVRLAERWLGSEASDADDDLQRIDDADWWVRKQLAASLGALPIGTRETALASLLERHADDPIVMDAALSGVRGSEAAVLERVAGRWRRRPERRTSRRRRRNARPRSRWSTSLIVRGGQDAAIQSVLSAMADESRPAGSARRCCAALRWR